MLKTVLCLLFFIGICLAANENATASSDEGVKVAEIAVLKKSEETLTTNGTRTNKAIDEEIDDLVVIVAGAPSVSDDIEVVNADDTKEGRAILVDGIPVDNSASGQAGFKLLKADDIKGEQEKEGRIKLIDNIPTDNTDSNSAGFRLPLGSDSGKPQERIIEVLVAEEEDDFFPKSLNSTASGRTAAVDEIDDVIIIEVGESSEVCFEDREQGTCDESIESYFYDHQKNKCQFFIYSGCGGNSNRFTSETECEEKCQNGKRGEEDKKKKVCESLAPACEEDCSLIQGEECLECSCTKVDPSVCSEASGKRGVCRAILLYWTFNSETKECETFTYGGCEAGASKNRFKTKELCQATCVTDKV